MVTVKSGENLHTPLPEVLFASHCDEYFNQSHDAIVNPMVFGALERGQNYSNVDYHLGGVQCKALFAEGFDIVVSASWLHNSEPMGWAGGNAHIQYVVLSSAVQYQLQRNIGFSAIVELMHNQHKQIVSAAVENLLISFLAEYELGFLVGALAGSESEAKIVAMLAGPPLLVQKMLLLGFHRGVQYTCPICSFYGMFYPTVKISEESIYNVVQTWVEVLGVDILFSTAEEGNGYTALRTAAQLGARVIGYEMDAYQTVFSGGEVPGGNNLMGTALKQLGNVAVHTVREIIRGVPNTDLQWLFSRDFPPSLPPMELLHRPDAYAGYSERTKDTLQKLMAQLATPEGLDPLFPFVVDRSRFQLDMDLFVPEPPANSWTRVPPGLRSPSGLRFGAYANLLTPLRLPTDETLFVFGGSVWSEVNGWTATSTMWQFNWRTQLWTDVMPELLIGTPPEPRSGHAMASVDGEKLIVFGGILANNGSAVNDLHAFALPLTPYGAPESTWSRLRGVSGLSWPVPRSLHTFVSSLDLGPTSALLFGGRTEAGLDVADLWRLDVDWGTSEASWQSLTSQPGVGAGVVGHVAVMVNGTMYVHGGNRSTAEWGNASPSAELWAYSVAGDSWTQLPSGPNPRWGHSIHVVEVEVGAGSTAGTEFFFVCVSGEGVNGPVGVDAYSLDTGSWVTSDQPTGLGPMSRPWYPSMGVGSRVLVVGGAPADGAAGEVETWVLHFAKLETSSGRNTVVLFDQSPVMVTTGVGGLLLLMVGALAFLSYRRKAKLEVARLYRQVDFSESQKLVIEQVMSDPAGIFKRVTLSREDVNVVSRIGVGAYGDVWTGRWHGIDCAVKRFLSEQLNETSMKSFRAEMELHMKLHHVNVIGFIGGCWEPPIVMLVLELAEGGPLSGRLTNTELPPLTWLENKLEMASGVASGMTYLHSRNPPVIHRDLKSANVLLDFQGVAKVADFGVSTDDVNEINNTESVVGSQYWLAPEVTRGEAYDESCDVYGFAIVLCEMAVRGGHVSDLFPGLSSSALALKISRGWRPDLALIDTDFGDVPGLVDLVEACWQHVAADRPKFEEVRNALENLNLGQPWVPALSLSRSRSSIVSPRRRTSAVRVDAAQRAKRIAKFANRVADLQERIAAVEAENVTLREGLRDDPKLDTPQHTPPCLSEDNRVPDFPTTSDERTVIIISSNNDDEDEEGRRVNHSDAAAKLVDDVV